MTTTNIILSAYPGRRVREAGCISTQIGLCVGGGGPQRRLAVEGLGGITRAVAEFGRDVLAANTGASFDISVSMAKGQRKPRGFDAAEKAGTFGHQAFLREDAGEDATYRKLVSPPVSGAAVPAALAA
ncbi:hypothetical protein EAH89_13245 [Roseomonas nepalensis]|uniref:Uncharacterized protein n=1 Tax=Muricoccus nepalensis TaxID=1854500 RepID=A0A502G2X2_9PROT|nr:hypothetical protein [Roseomonas nepalensis]TPG55900.1 hypothetical protein EAH89_13245 [Roseomonas nepalensis]